MRDTFSILFYIKRRAVRRDGRAPVMGRITVCGQTAVFATHRYAEPRLWDAARQKVRGRSPQAAETNRDMTEIRFAVERRYRELVGGGKACTARLLRKLCFGSAGGGAKLLEAFDMHNREFLREVGVRRSRSTYNRYISVRNHVDAFLKEKFGRDDAGLEEVDEGFVRDFELWLAAKGCARSTVWVYMMPLKKIVSEARRRGEISGPDPFTGRAAKPPRTERRFLDRDELERLMAHRSSDARLESVRRLFLFACFTGLSYCDVKALRAENLRRSPDGTVWIVSRRRKSRTDLRIPLLDFPLRIIESAGRAQGEIFDMPGNRECNAALERLSAETGITPKVTFHAARHTFATTVTLAQGMPIETVSALLGHRSIRTTQIYAKVVGSKIMDDMGEVAAEWNRAAKKCAPRRG